MLLLVCCHSSAIAQWPFVRGDIKATGVAPSALPENPDVVWQFLAEDSGFEATAVIDQGTIYVGDVDGTFYAIQLATG